MDQFNNIFDQLLAEFVQQGLVDYNGLRDSEVLPSAIALAAGVNPAKLDQPAQIAWWINAYNLFTLKLICDHYPVDSIAELHGLPGLILSSVAKRSAWDRFKFDAGGRRVSLNQIEQKILRKEYNEPRIHAALVCAAVSCPPLRSEAFRGDRLDRQLDDQMQAWVGDRSKNYYDADTGTLYLSQIFFVYRRDFTKSGLRFPECLYPFLDDTDRTGVQALARRPKIRYLKYDWALNRQ